MLTAYCITEVAGKGVRSPSADRATKGLRADGATAGGFPRRARRYYAAQAARKLGLGGRGQARGREASSHPRTPRLSGQLCMQGERRVVGAETALLAMRWPCD